MGIGSSQPIEDEVHDIFHITDTFANHKEWKKAIHLSYDDQDLPIVNSFASHPYIVYAVNDKRQKRILSQAVQDPSACLVCNTIYIYCSRKDFVLSNEVLADTLIERSFFCSLWSQPRPNREIWAIQQTYLAAGYTLAACSELNMASCLITEIDASAISDHMDLPRHVTPIAMIALGAAD